MFQRVEDLFCQSVRDARYFGNFFDAGLLQPLQSTHVLQQHLATLRPHPSIVSSELVFFTFARFLRWPEIA